MMPNSTETTAALAAFKTLMSAYCQAAGIPTPERHRDKYQLLIKDVVLIVSFQEHIDGPSVFVVANFDPVSSHSAELPDVILSHNFLLQAVGTPIMWGINPLTDQILAMYRLPMHDLAPAELGARLEIFVSSAKTVFDEMLAASLNLKARERSSQGANMRGKLMLQTQVP